MKPKSYALHPHTCDAHGMKYGHYYVVKVSFRPSNPVFRCIAFDARNGGSVRLVNGGMNREDEMVRLDQLAFFRVVHEIAEMQQRSSRFMPDDEDRAAEPALESNA